MKKLFTVLLAVALIMLLAAGCNVMEKITSQPEAPVVEAETPVQPEPEAQTPAEPEPAEQPKADPYAEILAQYLEAVQNGYSADGEFGEFVAFEWRANPQPVYYALKDIDANGTEELIIAAGEDVSNLGHYDIWTADGDTAVRPFDMDFGYRSNFDVLADGVIEVSWSNSAFESGCDYYRLEGAQATLVTSIYTTVDMDQPDVLLYMQDGLDIGEQAWNTLTDGYRAADKMAFDWISVG